MMGKYFYILLTAAMIFSCTVQTERKVLVYTRNGDGYVHENIQASADAIRELGRKHGFQVDVSDLPGVFSEEILSQYDALIFSNTNNRVFDTAEQRQALKRYVQAGGGVAGIHSACATEREWVWFLQMIGGKFLRHPEFQEFTVRVIDGNHPSTDFLDGNWVRKDECYFMNYLNPDIHVLLAADLTTVEDEGKESYPGKTFGDLFPLAWYHTYDGGRQWFTALGHSIGDYSDPEFLKHLSGGILWAMQDGKPDFSNIRAASEQ